MKNRTIEYWQKRAEIKDRKYIKDVKALVNKLKQEYVKAKKEIQKDEQKHQKRAQDPHQHHLYNLGNLLPHSGIPGGSCP